MTMYSTNTYTGGVLNPICLYGCRLFKSLAKKESAEMCVHLWYYEYSCKIGGWVASIFNSPEYADGWLKATATELG